MKRIAVFLMAALMLLGLAGCGRQWVEVPTVQPLVEADVSIQVTGYSKRWSTVDVVIENNTGNQLNFDSYFTPSLHRMEDGKWMRLEPKYDEYPADLVGMIATTGEWKINAKDYVNRLSPGSYRVAFTAKEARSASGFSPSFTVYDYFEVE